jgi:hypothetical protein
MTESDSSRQQVRVSELLQELVARGWLFMSVGETDGMLIGTYAHPDTDAEDSLRLRAVDDCDAARTLAGDGSGGVVVWRRESDVFSCIEDLLLLPAPGDPDAPRTPIARSPSMWSP